MRVSNELSRASSVGWYLEEYMYLQELGFILYTEN